MKYNLDAINIMDDNSSHALILRAIKPGSQVLEFGPASGYMTRYMKEQLGCRVYCVEFDETAAKIAAQYCEKIIVDDIEKFNWTKAFEGMSFEHILFADVLEHLRNPELVLQKAVELLKKDGTVITSLPNIGHNAIIMELLDGNFTYRSTGLLDNSHIHFFTKKSMLQMYEAVGIQPVQLDVSCAAPSETEFNQYYEDLPEAVQQHLQAREDGHVYQYIAVSKRKADVAEAGAFTDNRATNQASYVSLLNEKNKFKAKISIIVDTATLYVDTGNDFNEQEKITSNMVKSTDGFVVRFDLARYDGIHALRFDPIEGYPCACRLFNVKSDKPNLQLVPMNAKYCENGEYVLIDVDPRIAVTGDLSGVTYLEIEYSLRLLETYELVPYYNGIIHEKEGLVYEKNLLIDEKNKLIHERDNLIQERDELVRHLQAIFESKGYQMLTKLRNLKKKLLFR